MDSARQERMRDVYEQMVSISRRGIARNRLAFAPLTVVQYTLLTFIAQATDCRAIDVAQAMRLNRSTVSRQVGDLQALGLVEIAKPQGSAKSRGLILVLSARGEEVLQDSLRANQVELQRRLADWTDDEIDRLASGLERFNAADEGP